MVENFYRGLLYVLRERSEEEYFVIEGSKFHDAFGEIVKQAKDCNLTTLEVFIDPMFGRYPEVSDFIYEGLQNLIISVDNSCPQRAYYRISKEGATRELNRMENSDLYRKFADSFLKNSYFF
mgnify:CR=1 FL=1